MSRARPTLTSLSSAAHLGWRYRGVTMYSLWVAQTCSGARLVVTGKRTAENKTQGCRFPCVLSVRVLVGDLSVWVGRLQNALWGFAVAGRALWVAGRDYRWEGVSSKTTPALLCWVSVYEAGLGASSR